MTQRTLTAMYDSRGAAEAARDELVALGVPSADVTIHGTEAGSGQTTTENRGFWAELKHLFVPDEDRQTYAEGIRRGGCLLSAKVPEGLEDQAMAALDRSGPIDVDERSAGWRESGWQGYEGVAATGGATAASTTGVLREDAAGYTGEQQTRTTASMLTETGGSTTTGYGGGIVGGPDAAEGEEAIPIIEEEFRVGKREVGRGSVRVRSYVTERPVEEQVALEQERVTVERRPVHRELAPGEAAAAFQERTIEAVERGEEAVVSKTAEVVEEIGIRKDVERETETVRDTVRRQEVEVEDSRTSSGLAGTDESILPDRTKP
jgi:uncharacterized protein (TIGR02271 family)